MTTATKTAARKATKTSTRPQVTVSWTTKPDHENYFKDHGIEFELDKSFQRNKIHRDLSRQNHARLSDPLDLTRVDLLTHCAATTGVHLPPLVAWLAPEAKGLWVLNDGNHRDEFCERNGITTCWVYLLRNIGPATADMTTRVLNRFNGMGQTGDDAMAQAVDYARQPAHSHMTVKEVAKEFGVDPAKLQSKLRLAEYRTRFAPGGDMVIPGSADRVCDSAVEAVLAAFNDSDAVVKTVISGLATMPGRAPDVEAVRRMLMSIKQTSTRTEAARVQAADQAIAQMKAGQQAVLATRRSGKGRSAAVRRAASGGERIATEIHRLQTALNMYFKKGVNGKDLILAPARAALVTTITALRTELNRLQKDLV